MNKLVFSIFLIVSALSAAALQQELALHTALDSFIGDQLRTPHFSQLATLVESHHRAFKLMGFAVIIVLGLFAFLLLRLLRADRLARGRLEQALGERAAADAAWHQLDEAIEALSEGFVLYDAEDRLVRANRKYREFYADSAHWIIPGARFEDIVRRGALAGQYHEAAADPEGWVKERMARRAIMRTRGQAPFEQQLTDGRWLMISDRAMSNGGTVGIRTDITELKRHMGALERAREELRLESARARALAEANRQAYKLLDDAIAALNEGFAIWDKDDCLVTCNERYRQLYPPAAPMLVPGVQYADFARTVISSGHFSVQTSVEAAIAERVRRRRDGSGESVIEQFGDGRWVKITNRPVVGGGIVTVFTEITELKTREIELTRARNDLEAQAANMRELKEMAEAANHAKSGFLAMISHEIRTPMNAVLGLSALLAETALTAEQRRFVEGVEESGVHLIGLINDLLDFSRLEAEKFTLDIAPVSLRQVVGSAIRMMRVLAERKGLALNVEIDPTLPDGVEMDAARVNQVLINLIGNAIKFTPQGYVSLRVSGQVQPDGRLALDMLVQDTGSGIPPEVAERLFQPFERGMAHERGGISGTGLGLAITRRLVALMGGAVTLEPGGIGATFRVTFVFNRARVSLAPVETLPVMPGAGRALHVLVAEDTPASQLVICTLLERRGHRVTLVPDGAQALAEAKRGGFDLILLDIQMPHLSGLDVVRAIRALPAPLGSVPVVALSAQVYPADRSASDEAGFDDHLGKPLRIAELDRLIQRVAHGDFWRGGAPLEEEQEMESHGGDTDERTGIREAVSELHAMTGDAAIVELLDLALSNIDEEMGRLNEASLAADAARMRQAAHKLAGVLAQYGAASAARLAGAFERTEEANLPAQMAEVCAAIDRARAHLMESRAEVAA
ncbi:MAG: PAS-domain containing protein [Proteobacteria bacterium]|nr:PAS-domain containing protein [Pseudomonadota bacterium]